MSSLYTRLKITLGKADADDDALAAMQPDYKSLVADGKNLVFTPGNTQPQTGIIFYPGGRCEARAYAPMLRPLAEIGNLVVIPNMPLRLAVLDTNRASKIMAAYPDIKRWIIGGHSMGGAMAAAYAVKNPGSVVGLFFVASYPASMHAMPDTDLPAIMIYGTRDEVTRKSEFEASYARLPEHTKFVAIDGGDHYQFGSFANVAVTASISREEQQQQTLAALRSFILAAPY
jgi:pimeloyl-ACP methyl ester carboxylesterase